MPVVPRIQACDCKCTRPYNYERRASSQVMFGTLYGTDEVLARPFRTASDTEEKKLARKEEPYSPTADAVDRAGCRAGRVGVLSERSRHGEKSGERSGGGGGMVAERN
ncbi:uncharacterized protein SPSK_10813 [Sporothrix schenckii 1099-18]|uniref:Uncharacterized protein n=1 Tax=Sporothrix schenckii 1099-18 TaxID=1397361 RepID=A0A0F2MIJ2_SPOSC|nr:uncharacterized protein SPSK_10813 [Sporothrix schenckii 1099-18]KJR88889.1 hypothetical protein SPSK_10813 [Sporothrix schenckii 1099-18]